MEDSQPAVSPTWLQALGLLHIWSFILLGPLLLLLLVVFIVLIWRMQRGWRHAQASFAPGQEQPEQRLRCEATNATDQSATYLCTYNVTLIDDDGDALHPGVQKVVVRQGDDKQPEPGKKWSVVYDPDDPTQVTTEFLSEDTRRLAVGCLSFLAVFLAAYYAFNLKFRNNRTWQNVSGVFEGAGLLRGLLR